jgi:hypothetical protein
MSSRRGFPGYDSGIYKICTNPGAPQAEMLFFRLRGLLVKHVEDILKELNGIDGEPEFLLHYCTSFESFTTGTNYISELFRYLVGGFVAWTRSCKRFSEANLHCWAL